MDTLSFLRQDTQQNVKHQTPIFLMKFGVRYIICKERELLSWPWDVSALCSSDVDSARAQASGT